MAYSQLAGRVGASDRSPATRPVLAAVVILAALLGLVAWRWLPHVADVPRAAPQQAPAVITPPARADLDGPTEDQRLHLEHAEQALVMAAEQLTAARRLLSALGPELSRNYLTYEKRRADSAWTSCDTAAQAVEQARDDIKVVTVTPRKD